MRSAAAQCELDGPRITGPITSFEYACEHVVCFPTVNGRTGQGSAARPGGEPFAFRLS